jgi:hypothetical protein
VRPSLVHLLILSASQDVKFEFLVKSRVDQVKEAMTYSMKSENKLDGFQSVEDKDRPDPFQE